MKKRIIFAFIILMVGSVSLTESIACQDIIVAYESRDVHVCHKSRAIVVSPCDKEMMVYIAASSRGGSPILQISKCNPNAFSKTQGSMPYNLAMESGVSQSQRDMIQTYTVDRSRPVPNFPSNLLESSSQGEVTRGCFIKNALARIAEYSSTVGEEEAEISKIICYQSNVGVEFLMRGFSLELEPNVGFDFYLLNMGLMASMVYA